MTFSKCIGCGNCCRKRSIDITFSDILRWSDQKRWDILSEVSFIDNYPTKGQGGFYIETSLKTKEDMDRHCSFLTSDNLCSIHDTKPRTCSDAPLGYKEFKECPVFERASDSVANKVIKKQMRDIMAARKNFNIVMNVLVKARENGNISSKS